MNDEEIDSRVKNLLAQPEGYLDDEGFTRAVMDRLPPQRQPVLHTLRRRAALVGLTGIAASAVTWVSARPLVGELTPGSWDSVQSVGPLVAALLVAGCSIVAAVYPMAESLGKTLALRDVRVKKNGF